MSERKPCSSLSCNGLGAFTFPHQSPEKLTKVSISSFGVPDPKSGILGASSKKKKVLKPPLFDYIIIFNSLVALASK